MGVATVHPDVRLNATCSPAFPPPGATELAPGMSHFVSIGNKMDISTNDLIEFWAGPVIVTTTAATAVDMRIRIQT